MEHREMSKMTALADMAPERDILGVPAIVMKLTKNLLACVCLLIQPVLYAASGKNDLGKPNFILIMADDLGYGDVGCYGSKQIPTPNIDRLAAEGLRFTNGYVSSPVCSPSRAGTIVGRNQACFGHCDNLSPTQPGFDPEFAGLPLTEMTIADRLKPLGYTSGIVGKWHLGGLPQFHPMKRGFDEFWGYLGGSHNYFTSAPDGKDQMSPILSNYMTPKPITYLTDDIGDVCVDFISRHKEKPFFLYAAFGAPHSPMQATAGDLKLFAHIKDRMRRTYCAMVYRLDQNVGRILESIRKEGIESKTVVVFLSDNGGPAADAISNGSINAPLRGGKTTVLEGGIRVPFILKWPSVFKTGVTVDETISSLDLGPTFVALAGGSYPKGLKGAGVNIMPFLTGETDQKPHTALQWTYTVGTAIREGDWKLIHLPDRLPMLYNLAQDLSEQHDVALQHPELSKALLKKLGNWKVHNPHPVFHEPATWRVRHLSFHDINYQLTQPD